MINYFYDCYTILNKVYSEKAFFKQALNNTPIEEKNRALIVKTCYGVLDKDIELSYYIEKLTTKTPKLVIRTILKISMYALKYLNKHDYAVIKNAVELTKKLGKGGASGFVNAFLRRFVKEDIALPKDRKSFLSVKYSYPLFLIEELVKDYGEERTEKIISSINENTCLSFYKVNGEEYLTERNYQFEKTPFDNVFIVKNFVRNSDYDLGVYTYQALGSVAICESVEPCKTLLDACSAPGGKSIRLSKKCESIYSTDIHPHRVNLITEYKNRMGVKNITESVMDASEFNPEFKDKFDAVLCDAPCSGTGVINDNPDIKLNRSFNDLLSIVDTQKAILKNLSNYVKVGGYLYYSTCSILTRENQAIIKSFLSDKTDFSVCEISSSLPFQKCEYGIQFLPDISNGLGFYICKLKREK